MKTVDDRDLEELDAQDILEVVVSVGGERSSSREDGADTTPHQQADAEDKDQAAVS